MNDSNTKLTANWFEIPVMNIQKASGLYAAMLDTTLAITDFRGMPHAVLGNAGALTQDPTRPPSRGNGPVLYLNAPDGVQRCLARAVEAGAKVVQPYTKVDPHGAIALIEDLDGNVIGLHEHPTA